MAHIEISDLVFPAFNKGEMKKLPENYGIEIFYEFGNNAYWDGVLRRMGADKRPLSFHGPCVTVNLADPDDTDYLKRYEETFQYAKEKGASHIVVHTNEHWEGNRSAYQALVVRRLHEIEDMAKKVGGAKMLIENVGLGQYNLFDEDEYVALFDQFKTADSIIDVGHAHVNGWDTCRVIQRLGSRIGAFHLQDNSGHADEHLPLFAGNIDWTPLAGAIRAYAPDATRVFEYANGDYLSAEELVSDIEQARKELEL